jgi:hypothetical protein
MFIEFVAKTGRERVDCPAAIISQIKNIAAFKVQRALAALIRNSVAVVLKSRKEVFKQFVVDVSMIVNKTALADRIKRNRPAKAAL